MENNLNEGDYVGANLVFALKETESFLFRVRRCPLRLF